MGKNQNSKDVPEYVQKYYMAYDNLKNALDLKAVRPLSTREGQESKPFIDFVIAVREVIRRKMNSNYGVVFKNGDGESCKVTMKSLVQAIRDSGEYIYYETTYRQICNTYTMVVDDLLDHLQEKIVMLEVRRNYFTNVNNAHNAYNLTNRIVLNELLDLVRKINRDEKRRTTICKDSDDKTSLDVDDIIDYNCDTEKEACLKLAVEMIRKKIVHDIVRNFIMKENYHYLIAFINELAGRETKELYADIKDGGYLNALNKVVIDLKKGGIDLSYLMKVNENDFTVPVNMLTSEMISKWKYRALEQVKTYVKKAYANQLSMLELAYENMDRYMNYKKRKSSG